jgi:hypothetical protein
MTALLISLGIAIVAGGVLGIRFARQERIAKTGGAHQATLPNLRRAK